MFGSLLSSVVKIVTLPVDVANITVDHLTGGDGSKASRTSPTNYDPFSEAEKLRDAIAKAIEDIDN